MKIKIGSGDYELWLANLRENQSVLKSLKAEKSANNTDTLDYEDTYLFGSIDEIEGRIEIEKYSCVNARKLTFWHEVVHGLMYELGMRELGNDEGFVEALGRLLYRFTLDNNLDKIYTYLEKKWLIYLLSSTSWLWLQSGIVITICLNK